MNQTLQELELNLYKSLMNLSCQPLKNISNIEPNITLKEILTNATYLDEKLNLFIWLMFKFEPKFATEFVDYEFYAADIKCKKILEGLYSLGLIDPSEFNVEKIINSNIKYYKITLYVLNELSQLLQSKLISQYSSADDIFSLDLMLASGVQDFQSPTSQQTNYFEELFSKKVQLFDDSLFLKEYKNILQSNSSLIPSDLNRLLKSINENHTYLKNFQYSKNISKEEFIQFLEQEANEIEDRISQYPNKDIEKDKNISIDTIDEVSTIKNKLDFSDCNIHLVETTKLLKNFNQFVQDVQASLDSTKAVAKNTTHFDVDLFGVESNLGKNFDDLRIVNKTFKKISKHFSDWSNFISLQSRKQNDYAASSLVKDSDLEFMNVEMNRIETELQEFLCMLGLNEFESKPKICSKEPTSNQTMVDQLLML